MINLKIIKDAGFAGKAAPADAGPAGPSRGKGKGGGIGGGKKGGVLAGLLTDLVAWYPMNETTGNRVNAHDPGTYDLVPYGAASFQAGILGNAALGSDGTDGGFVAPAGAMLDTGLDWTVALWGYAVAQAANTTWVSFNVDFTTLASRLYRPTADKASFSVYSTISSSQPTSPTLTFANGAWYCYITTYTASTKTCVLTVNDASSGSVVCTNHGRAFSRLGVATLSAAANGYDVAVDELALAQRVWTAEEQTAYYNDGAGVTYTDL